MPKTLLTLLIAACCVAPTAANPVAVRTSDGGRHRGVVDARTDGDSLWLRHDEPSLSIAHPIRWNTIEAASIDGEPLASDQIQATLMELATARPMLSVLVEPIEAAPYETPYTVRRPVSPRIVSLSATAAAVNWDADAQADGIEVAVAALDKTGHAWPVRGSLTVRLLGARRRTRHRFETGELQRWSESVSASHFDPVTGAAVYRFPYRALEPEADGAIGPEAVAHVTLGVYGQGRYEASAPVWLRPVSPLRDQQQLGTGRRLLPIEDPLGPPQRVLRQGPAGRFVP